jgi:hypothetical protein
MNFIPPVVNTQSDQRNYNVPIYGIRGEFSLSPVVKVPYFTCLMDIGRVTQELKTHEEVNPSLDTTYSLVELFQRQIDIDRVKREIVDGYLRQNNKIKFFNSLTIVLLPKNSQGKLVSAFEDYPNNDPPIPDQQFGAFDAFFAPGQAADVKAVFGGVQFVTTKTESLARLRWDKNRVDAVAVDGQHRLRALKLWMEGKNQQLSDTERPTRIPILFLMLHEAAGFAAPTNSSAPNIKAIAREIFTDLNKNAREVDLATQIILDDLSIESCCVRALVTDTTCTDDDHLLPLSLLRWQEANNRFDQKYYLNSLVNLHLIVKELLSIEPPADPMSKTAVLGFIGDVSKLLGSGVPRQLSHQGVSLDQYYRSQFLENDEDEPIAPFGAIPSHYLPSAVEGFKAYFAPWLLAILKRFAPYAEIISYARENKLITGQFGQYLSQPKSHQEALAKDLETTHGQHWRKAIIDDHSASIERIKGVGSNELGEQWAFKTIFQKAIVRLGRSLFVGTAADERARFGDVNDYLEFLNTLHRADVFRVHAKLAPPATHNLWTFIAVNYGNKKIKVASSSEARILGILTLWYFGRRYAIEQGKKITVDGTVGEEFLSAIEILRYLSTKGAQSKWPTVCDQSEALRTLFGGGANAAVIQGATEPPPEAIAKQIGKQRLEQVFIEGMRPFAHGNDSLTSISI